MPGAGVPLSRPEELRVTPLGSGPGVEIAGVGKPVKVTWNEPGSPMVKVVWFALVMVGGRSTVRLAEAVLPAPPLVEVTAEVVFV